MQCYNWPLDNTAIKTTTEAVDELQHLGEWFFGDKITVYLVQQCGWNISCDLVCLYLSVVACSCQTKILSKDVRLRKWIQSPEKFMEKMSTIQKNRSQRKRYGFKFPVTNSTCHSVYVFQSISLHRASKAHQTAFTLSEFFFINSFFVIF